MKFHALPCVALTACAVFMVAGCALGPIGQASTPTPSRTPIVPREVPAGWRVYQGSHFAMAYPAGWSASDFPQGDSTPSQPDIVYSFTSPSDPRDEVIVQEADGVDSSTIQATCSSHKASDQLVTLNGLSMFYSTSIQNMDRDWTFVTDRGVVYQAQTADGPNVTPAPTDAVKADMAAVVATFTPEYTTSGCK